MLNSITSLIVAIASLIGALSGFVGLLIVVRRTSPRERRDAAQVAAETAAEKTLGPPNPGLDAAGTLIGLHEAQAQREDRDEPGSA